MNNFKNKGVTFVKTINETFFRDRNKPFAEYEKWKLNEFCKTVSEAGAKDLVETLNKELINVNEDTGENRAYKRN